MLSIKTVQAPHWPSPQPYFVPVRSSCSRRTESKLDCESASIECFVPLTSKLKILAIGPRNSDLEKNFECFDPFLLHFLRRAYTLAGEDGSTKRSGA